MKIIEQGYVTPKSKSNFRYNAWPTVITLKDGTLLAGWSGERLKHICPFGKAMMARSEDGGHTWLPAYVAQDTVLDDRDVGLLQVGDKVIMSSVTNDRNMQRKHQEHWLHHPDTEEKKRLVAAYLDMITDEEEERFIGPYVAVSNDNGYTFSEPKMIPLTCPHGPILTKEGKILFVGKFSTYGKRQGYDLEDGIYALELDEECNIVEGPWMVAPLPEEFNSRSNFCEPHAAQLPNGDILVAIRREDKLNDIHTMYLCRSTDGGKTFTKAENTGFDGFPPHLFVDSKGRVILSYGKRHDPMGVRVRVSYDNGYTFGDELVIRDNGVDWDLGYAATTENDKGQMVTVYYMKDVPDVNENRICYAIWEIE